MRSLLHTKGFGLLEIIVAIGLWIVIVSSGSVLVVGGLKSNRLAGETTEASSFAAEGIDALKSIKKQGWTTPLLATSCTTGCGIATVSGTWGFSGANNVIGKYTRQVFVNPVNRDGSGNIVSSGGTPDSDTYLARSTVTWSPGGVRNAVVSVYTYLTNYARSIATALTGAIVIYGDGTATPKYRTYDRGANSFSAEISTVVGASGNTFSIKTSPTKTEAISGYTTAAGVLQVMCFDGTTWSNDWSVTVGGTSTTKRFEVAYETNSGDALVLYSTNTATTNELAYRTKSGATGCGAANWSAAQNLNPIRTSGIVQWVKMRSDPLAGSNNVAAIWADANSDLSAMIWSGTAWVNEPTSALATTLEVVSAAQDVDDFDVEYESVSGDVMIMFALAVGSNGTNGVRYVTCTGGISMCTWSSVLTPPTLSDDATHLDISANPNSNEIIFASIGNAGSDLQRCYWSGTAFTCAANVDTSCTAPSVGTKRVVTGWLISGGTTRSIIIYQDSGATKISWYACRTSTCTVQADITVSPIFSPTQGWYKIEMDPVSKDQLMLLVSASMNSFYAKRVVMTSVPAYTWTNADGSTALGTALPSINNNPYSFAYWRQ